MKQMTACFLFSLISSTVILFSGYGPYYSEGVHEFKYENERYKIIHIHDYPTDGGIPEELERRYDKDSHSVTLKEFDEYTKDTDLVRKLLEKIKTEPDYMFSDDNEISHLYLYDKTARDKLLFKISCPFYNGFWIDKENKYIAAVSSISPFYYFTLYSITGEVLLRYKDRDLQLPGIPWEQRNGQHDNPKFKIKMNERGEEVLWMKYFNGHPYAKDIFCEDGESYQPPTYEESFQEHLKVSERTYDDWEFEELYHNHLLRQGAMINVTMRIENGNPVELGEYKDLEDYKPEVTVCKLFGGRYLVDIPEDQDWDLVYSDGNRAKSLFRLLGKYGNRPWIDFCHNSVGVLKGLSVSDFLKNRMQEEELEEDIKWYIEDDSFLGHNSVVLHKVTHFIDNLGEDSVHYERYINIMISNQIYTIVISDFDLKENLDSFQVRYILSTIRPVEGFGLRKRKMSSR